MKKLDITGEVCPITFIKVKLVLEDLEPGDTLEVRLDCGVPSKNVPKSLRSDGHKILSEKKAHDGSVVLVVEKGAH
ncbi:MAG: sulfurtransferase TusA family protein [Bacillota bacterium]|nr:sulfurtransferase TusA family protein [Bacillota bacterium]MDW7684036.1 sulfurtransferase TusA family protein [Bacillota bacterium]